MNPKHSSDRWVRALFLGAGMCCLPWLLEAAPGGINLAPSPSADTQHFFTNLADRLLQSQLGMNLGRIQVHPTNQYCPAVHRILQVAANLLEATTNAPLPSVFRPQFGPHPTLPGVVVIADYVPDNDAATAAPNLYGIPYIIGARKGIPNFNEAVLKTMVQAVRKVEVRRQATNRPPHLTNEMFLLAITNFVGVEFWNSYSSNYLAALGDTFQLTVSNVIRTCLTNETHSCSPTNPAPWNTLTTFVTNIDYAADPDWFFQPRPRFYGGFAVPLSNAAPVLTNMIYRPIAGTFEPVGPTNDFTANNGLFITPQWGLGISNELTCMLSVNGRILDFVHLPSIASYINITEQLMSEGDGPTDTGYNLGWLWRTNRILNSASLNAPTEGVMQQIALSLNPGLLSDWDWRNYNYDYDPVTGNDRFKASREFAFFLTTNYTNTSLAMQTPFNPIRKFVQTVSLQANDPLVHYRLEDLVDQTNGPVIEFLLYLQPPFTQPPFTNSSLGKLNERYRPWGGNPLCDCELDPPSFDLGVKDPGVWRSDDWQFPTDLRSDLALVGRVHRGTPWQTIYLKSAVADPSRWAAESPDPRTHPTNDWRLVSTLVSLWGTNDPRALLSINETNAVAWGNVLHGLTVLSNLPLAELLLPPQFEVLTMTSNSPQAALIAAGINRTRSTSVPQYFETLGDLFATPELSTASPWLDRTGEISLIFELNDAAYEAVPAQLLARVRADPVGQIFAEDDRLRFRFRTFPGSSFTVEASANLREWEELGAGFTADGIVEFLGSARGGLGQQFYRLQVH